MQNWQLSQLPGVTAENMLERANVTKLDTVLVTGASGGVGSALVQLANRRGAVTMQWLRKTNMISWKNYLRMQ